jgi:hypothetical protein
LGLDVLTCFVQNLAKQGHPEKRGAARAFFGAMHGARKIMGHFKTIHCKWSLNRKIWTIMGLEYHMVGTLRLKLSQALPSVPLLS